VVTLVFTDIEGSTGLLGELGAERYRDALGEHRRVVREACARYDGYEVDYEGDAFFYAFASASAAVAAVREAVSGLEAGPIRIRVGIHTGEPALDPPKYVGLDVHQAARVMSAAHGGQVVVSPSTAALLDEGSFELVGLGSHRLKDFDEPVSLSQLGGASFPPLRTLANTNLPTPVSRFVGREAELAEADRLLREARLVTITGPGGAGKTRFAVELAQRVREERFGDYPDGVFACFLSSLRDPQLVLPTVAYALSLREQPGLSALDTLVSHLAGKRMLVVLDNVEHMLEAAGDLSQLLRACPGLTLLCTSRELLRIGGEASYELPPMPPDESVSLFCERAQTKTTPAIEELCRRLDGLPLALELAAARTRLLSPEQLLERLSQRLDLLRGDRDADPRQQTLRATVQWSFDLLTDEEQELFARLAVFVGGCSLEAAEAVCDADLQTLASLLDKSLLRRSDEETGLRFWMHELIREFADEQLDLRGETDVFRLRHAEHYLALADRAECELRGHEQERWLERIEQQHANFPAAIETLIAQRDIEAALRTAGALLRYWERRGRIAEGRALLDRALSESAPVLPQVRAKALYSAGFLAYFQDDREGERASYGEALELYRQCGDASGELLTELELAYMSLLLDDVVPIGEVEQLVHRADALADTWTHAYACLLMGDACSVRGDLDRARSAYGDAVALFDAAGDPRMARNARGSVAWADVLGEQYEAAAALLTQAIPEVPYGDAWQLLIMRGNLGLARLFLGEDEHAARELCASLQLSALVGAQRPAAESLLALAAIASRALHVEAAGRLRGASLAIRDASGGPPGAVEERIEARFLSGLEESVRAAGEATGRSMTLGEAAKYALELSETLHPNAVLKLPR
jgi:predicted ATPase